MQAANRCEAVIFLVSANWLASGWCLKEYALARGLNKKLFAALIDPAEDDRICSPTSSPASGRSSISTGGQDMRLFPRTAAGLARGKARRFPNRGLCAAEARTGEGGARSQVLRLAAGGGAGRAPYRGLKPLEAVDAGIFFGRDAPIVEATDRLRGLRAGAAPRLMVILGASGAGKSSFLRAGLLPRLARDDAQFLPLPLIRPERAALTGENGLAQRARWNPAGSLARRPAGGDRRPGRRACGRCWPNSSRRLGATLASEETAKPPVIVDRDRPGGGTVPRRRRDGRRGLVGSRSRPAIERRSARSSRSSPSARMPTTRCNTPRLSKACAQSALPLLPMPRGAYQGRDRGPGAARSTRPAAS